MRPTSAISAAALALTAVVGALLPASPAAATVTRTTGRVSITPDGQQAASPTTPLVSSDGRYVAFTAGGEVWVRDVLANQTAPASLTSSESSIGAPAALCALSRDGRFVVFQADSPTLLGAAGPPQLYVRDRVQGTTELVSANSSDQPMTNSGAALDCAISDDGRYVAFSSDTGNVQGGGGGSYDVFRRDRTSKTTQAISNKTGGAGSNGDNGDVSMSANGNRIAFASSSTNLVDGDTNGMVDAFVHDVAGGWTHRANLSTNGVQANAPVVGDPILSANGLNLAFTTAASNLITGDTNGKLDAYQKSLVNGQIWRSSQTLAGTQLDADSKVTDVSSTGQFVVFETTAPIADDDTGTTRDVYLRDLGAVGPGALRASVTSLGTQANGPSANGRYAEAGKRVVFSSQATNLGTTDANGSAGDLYLRSLHQDLGSPFPTTNSFVVQQFADFAGRAPTDAELDQWGLGISRGAASPESFIDDLAHAPAWASKRGPVARLYWAFFLRAPDRAGLEHWVGKLQAGRSLTWVASQFAASSEFQNRYGAKSNIEFVTLVYQNVFERKPDVGGLTYWTTRLDTGAKTRGDVMVNFSESSEGKRFLAAPTDTTLVWLGMMRALPSKATFAAWVTALRGGAPLEQQIATIRLSSAYLARFL